MPNDKMASLESATELKFYKICVPERTCTLQYLNTVEDLMGRVLIDIRTSTANAFINVAIFWDAAPCSSFVNRRFGTLYHLHLQRRKSAERENSLQQVASQLLFIL
jgi:hypothetical protein